MVEQKSMSWEGVSPSLGCFLTPLETHTKIALDTTHAVHLMRWDFCAYGSGKTFSKAKSRPRDRSKAMKQ